MTAMYASKNHREQNIGHFDVHEKKSYPSNGCKNSPFGPFVFEQLSSSQKQLQTACVHVMKNTQ